MAHTARFGHRIDAALRRRAPRGAPPLEIPGRRVYILPSATGGLFGVLLVVMLLGATNYGNNLAFLLTFWLAGVALVSMHRAHRNLAGLEIASVQAAPVFAGEIAVFDVTLTSRARLARRGLTVQAANRSADNTATRGVSSDAGVSTSPESPAIARLTSPALRRGRIDCPRLTIASRYPMGLFRCWSHAVPTAHALVYPAPADVRGAARPAAARSDASNRLERIGEALFAGHRQYRPGDALRRIDWKASARTDEWMVTEDSDTRAPTARFDYTELDDLAPEARLSQLAFWIVEADRHRQSWTLVLPGQTLGPASGSAHRRACLEALALF